MIKIGIIGGTGFGSPDILDDVALHKMHTPYGPPSASVVTGKLAGREIVTIARHGAGHSIPPSKVNFRANIWAMKQQGVTHIIAVTAVGSLREEIAPGHLVFPDQFIDRTTKREATFFEGHEVCHIPMADPFCEKLRQVLISSAARLGLEHHGTATVITIEGPRFSTRAESRMFRQWDADIINMSTVPEVVLAREAGICYGTVAMSTDYDCWHASEEPVTWELIQKTMNKNTDNVKQLLFDVVPKISFSDCSCMESVTTSIL
ncbi:MAG: S-methyl-5'-thioadenosine phosphorylase [Deltaproteobacteria bacterium]|nr:S-methyl-5'-thioadenosine phosphorylase [Deltaproteobacteria bacterium]